jgi:transmembrane sensor
MIEAQMGIARSEAIEAEAAAWLEQRDRADWTVEDQATLDEWLLRAPAHAVAYWRLEGAWGYADRLAALRGAPHEKKALVQPRLLRRLLSGIAIALVFAAILGGMAGSYLLRMSQMTYATPVGGHKTVVLADGSRIELDTDTVLRMSISSDRRIAWLDRGETYFQIAHDASRPFIVIAGNRRVTDLGTSFMIRRDAGKLEVAVVEGRVWFDPTEDRTKSAGRDQLQPVLLSQGDAAVATDDGLSLTKKPMRNLMSELGWRRGVLVFSNTTLAEAAMEFNRYNQQKLIIADREAGRSLIGATFRTNDVELFAKVARDVLGLHVEKRGQDIVISR